MKWKELKQNLWFRILTNKYLLITVFFLVWILFLDGNAWLTSHRALDEQIAEQEENVRFYKDGILRDSLKISQLESVEGLERYARERYHMKREGEKVYIIERKDSLKTEK
ncbi:MAG: septum formation initiator family protein [Nonlabens sp.]